MIINNELQSRVITFLRLPLIVGVVFIHTGLTELNIGGSSLVKEGDFPFHDILHYLVSEEIACIAVPLFFFMSGFLFFTNTNFTFSAYKNKLAKRVHTLLIPYFFWNMINLILFFLTQMFLSSMTSGANKLIVEYTISDWLGAFWVNCYQFWFIRDLMVVTLFSPIIYVLVKYFKAIGVVILGILWCFDLWFHLIGFSSVSFFFFSFGAWFAVHQHNFVADFNPLRYSFTVLYILIVMANIFLWYKQIEEYFFIHKIGIVVGLIAIIPWTAYGIQKGKLKCSALLAGGSFFIYAYHGMPIAFFNKIWVRLIQPATELTMILGYILIPILIVGLGLGCYILMKKYIPRFTSFITGGR